MIICYGHSLTHSPYTLIMGMELSEKVNRICVRRPQQYNTPDNNKQNPRESSPSDDYYDYDEVCSQFVCHELTIYCSM